MKDKYIDKKYFKLSEYFGLPDELGMVGFVNLIEDISRNNNSERQFCFNTTSFFS